VLLTTTVLLETEWVLRSRHGASRQSILAGLRLLIGLDRLTLEQPLVVMRAIDWFKAGLDFADALHLASSRTAAEFVTFDQTFARRAARLGSKPPVRHP
jgi:predicted nucleic-acid-binding protein